MKVKIVVIIILSLFISNFCIADVGCLSDLSDFIYINKITGTGPNGGPQYAHVSEASRINRSQIYCFSYTTTPSSPCYIDTTRQGYPKAPGTLVNFFYVNCPLDDYVSLGIFVMGMIGFIRLSGRSIIKF